MEWQEWKGKKVYVVLNSKKRYSGIIKEVEFIGKNELGTELWLISLIDKFGKFVSFSIKEIESIAEER